MVDNIKNEIAQWLSQFIYDREEVHLDGDYALQEADSILSIVIPNSGGVCPECSGTGYIGQSIIPCPECQCAGRLKDKILGDLVEEYLYD